MGTNTLDVSANAADEGVTLTLDTDGTVGEDVLITYNDDADPTPIVLALNKALEWFTVNVSAPTT